MSKNTEVEIGREERRDPIFFGCFTIEAIYLLSNSFGI